MKRQDLSTRSIPVPHSPIPSFTPRNVTTGTLAASGVILSANASITALWIMVQVSAATSIQLLMNGEPISAAYNVEAKTIVRFAGTLVPNNARLQLAVSVACSYEIAWLKDGHADLIVRETAFFNDPTNSGGTHQDVDIFDSTGQRIATDGNGALITNIQDSVGSGLSSSGGGLWTVLIDHLGNFFGSLTNAIYTRLTGPSGNTADVDNGGNVLVLNKATDPDGTVEPVLVDKAGKLQVVSGARLPRIIQRATGVTTAALSFTVAFPNPVKQGNSIVICGACDSSGIIAFSVADTLKNQFLMVANGAANIGLGIFYAPIMSAGGADTITISVNTPLAIGAEIYEVEGIGELETSTSTATVGGASLVLAVGGISQENCIAFLCVGAGAGTISAANPSVPASLVYDSGNQPIAGANLQNFGAFSALMGAPVGSTSTSFSNNTNNNFAVAFSASVAARSIVAIFRPASIQVRGAVLAQGLGATDLVSYPVPLSNTGNSLVVAVQGTAGDSFLNTSMGFVKQVATSLLLAMAPHLYNGTSWDRQRGNTNGITGDTGAKTATFNGALQTNFNNVGAYITILLGVVSGTTPTLSAQLQFSPDGGTTWLNLGPALANLTASNQTGVIAVYPSNFSQSAGATPANLTTGATQSLFLNTPLPRTWRIVYTIAGTTPSFALTNTNVQYVGQ